MRREEYQPRPPRNRQVCQKFDLACVKCNSAEIHIIGELDEESGEVAVSLYCLRCQVREPLSSPNGRPPLKQLRLLLNFWRGAICRDG